jgi:hypothetical protein
MPPVHLRYRLSRLQRLRVLLAMEGVGYPIFGLLLFAFFCFAIVLNAREGRVRDVFVFAAFALGMFLLWRTVFLRLLSVLFFKWHEEDLLVEEKGIGILRGKERWYFFLDSITSIKQYCPDLWTIRQYTGLVLHIPIELISDEQLQHWRAKMERGRTAEGVQAIIARGRMIEQLERK